MRVWVGKSAMVGTLGTGADEMISVFELGGAGGEEEGGVEVGDCELGGRGKGCECAEGEGAGGVGYGCVWGAGMVEEGGLEGEEETERREE